MTEMLGPLELIVLGFEGNKFTGEITPALLDLVDRGIVRIIDLAIVVKDGTGEALILERQELNAEVAVAMSRLVGAIIGLLSEADLIALAEDMEPNSTIAVFLCEHLWATQFATAVRASNGVLVLSERIPGDVVDAARANLVAFGDAA